MALFTLKGSAAAPGIGHGRAYVHGGPATPAVPTAPTAPTHGAGTGDHRAAPILPFAARDAEVERLRRALSTAAVQLEGLGAELSARVGAAEGAVFEAQALFLHDPALVAPMEAAIRDEGLPALPALDRVVEAAARDLEALDDPYLAARAADLRDVKERVSGLLGAPGRGDLSRVGAGMVVFARDLTPSETVELRQENVRGLVLAEGTATAHAAILARGLGLPLVLGVGAAIWQVAQGQPVIVDGTDGTVLVEPDADERDEYLRRAAGRRRAVEALRAAADQPLRTRDGRRVELLANASSPAEARLALENGAEGIGLLRTEFMLAALQDLDSGRGAAPPDEAALADAYAAILAPMRGRPVVVRAMDAGGDKPLPFLDVGYEANPFLGWRGIRVLLDRPELFAAQTRALLRAAARHDADLRLMFPMVTTLDEFVRARRLVERVYRDEGVVLAHPLRIGVMIEVPAAALIADALAREADFFSLGTNDLVQYTLACDRGNPRVAPLCQFLHPAVLRLVDLVVRAAHAAGRPVGVCGEVAGDPAVAPLLVGLGVDELSVGVAGLLDVRGRLRSLEYARLQHLATAALARPTAQEVVDLVSAGEAASQ